MSEGRATLSDLRRKKKSGEKILVLVAYDHPMARLADEAGADIILVSDALGMVGLGYESTVPVTIEEMIHHTKAVVRARKRALVVTTMPFMSYSVSDSQALNNAGRLMKEACADAVELEGGPEIVDTVKTLTDAGIPVVPHIGLTRQHLTRSGTFAAQGRDASSALGLLRLARSLDGLGVPAVLLECIPDRVASLITESLGVPTIGIGAGPHCDGQAMVSHDLLGLFEQFVPRFVKRYRHLAEDIRNAFGEFRKDVESGAFPGVEHGFRIKDEEFGKLRELLEGKE